jgi:serine/threonine-protein kinase
MELVEGTDLAGPVPADTALACARQIAKGLAAAHKKGMIHRGLKPANIRVTSQGAIKLLDLSSSFRTTRAFFMGTFQI